MLQAIIHGKTSPEQVNMEDILTSNVFGALRHVPPGRGLLPFLKCAEFPDRTNPLAALPDGTEAKYEFWPLWQEADCIACEPDVAIRLDEPGGKKHLVLVEAKYRSGKSSYEGEAFDVPCDQLAREWDNLTRVAEREKREPLLIYLTADIVCPAGEIAASEKEYASKREFGFGVRRFRCAWLSWRHQPWVYRPVGDPLLDELGEAMLRLNMTFYRGIRSFDAVLDFDWRFKRPRIEFAWSLSPWIGTQWRFRA